MSIQRADIIELLDVDEPDYEAAAELGDDAIPFLLDIAEFGRPLLAQKATALAAMITSDRSASVIRIAAQRIEPAVRVAAAAALADLAPSTSDSYLIAPETEPMDDVLEALLADEDEGVRRFAEESAQARKDATLQVEDLGEFEVES